MTIGCEGDILKSIEVKVAYFELTKGHRSTVYKILGNSEREVLSTGSEKRVTKEVRDYIESWGLKTSNVKITDLGGKGYKKLPKEEKDKLKESFFVGDDLHCEA